MLPTTTIVSSTPAKVRTAAIGQGVGSRPKAVVEPVGDVRELSRFSFRVTTPALAANEDPDGWLDLRIEGFGTSERRPGAPSRPSHTVLVALPPEATPRLLVEPIGVRLLAGRRPRPVPRARVDVDMDTDVGEDGPRRRVRRFDR